MRTKKIEMKVNGPDWSICGYSLIIKLTPDQYESLVDTPSSVIINISFEIPLPEPKREITPSMIDDHLVEYKINNEGACFSKYLKQKLFPDWSDS